MFKFYKKKLQKTSENNKSIINNVLGAFLIKGGAVIISLLTMPAYIRYFDNQQILGLWFTILSVLMWVLTFDLGIGNGLRNYLVQALVAKNNLLAKKYISSAYVVIGIIALLICGLSIITFKYINWNTIFNIPINIISQETLNITVNIVFCSIMLQFFLRLISSILYAMQKSALNNLLSLFTSIIILIYVSFSPTSNLSANIISLAIVHVLAVNVPLLITTLILFSTKLKYCKPSIKYFGKKHAKDVLKLGGLFLWVQIMYMIITTTNEFLITWLSGPKMVVEYQIYNKLFTLIGTIFALGLTPIWSVVTKAIAEKDYIWVKKLYKVLVMISLLATICEFSMIPFLQFGINIWLGSNSIEVNYFYATVFAISGSIFIWNSVISSIANGVGKLKAQTIFFTIGAIIKIPLAWIFVMYLDSWIGVIVANIIAMSLYCCIQPILLNRFLNNNKKFGDEVNV